MARLPRSELSKYWAGLGVLERLVEPGSSLSTEDLAAILGTKGVTGVGAALAGTRHSLRESGIRLDEALIKRSVRGRTVWSQGPRIQQTIHVLRRHRHEFMNDDPQPRPRDRGN